MRLMWVAFIISTLLPVDISFRNYPPPQLPDHIISPRFTFPKASAVGVPEKYGIKRGGPG